MLCEEIEVNGTLKQFGLDGAKVTQAYRELIAKELQQCEAQGDVAEWKEVCLVRVFVFLLRSNNRLRLSGRLPIDGDASASHQKKY